MLVGILGGGQLGRMTALAGLPLGINFRFLDPSPHATAASVGDHICAAYDDNAALEQFADSLDFVSLEFENVPAHTLDYLADHARVRPCRRALEVSQDRATEKHFFQTVGVSTGEWRQVDSLSDMESAFADFGESIIKTRRFGYDGKGQARIRSKGDCAGAWEELGSQPLIIEKLVPFQRELSLVAVRSSAGEFETYPLVQNEHSHGILRKTVAPAPDVSPETRNAAETMIRSIMNDLDYIGVLTIELFDVGGQLLVNEMAPRVHNSGHWTIEGAVTSQFENHVRAICDLPLGSTALRFPSVMVNCIGAMPPTTDVLQIKGAHLHDYQKSPRSGRKVGHITVCDQAEADEPFSRRLAALEALVAGTPQPAS